MSDEKYSAILLKSIGDVWDDGMEQNGMKTETLINNHHSINSTVVKI